MTGGPNRSLEDLLGDRLRDRLHEMDAVDPPEPDFEFRALRAGRERLKRRQAWTRGLVGAAAAVVIGAVAIPSLGRLDVSGGGTATSGGAGAASAPEAATNGSAQDLKAPGAAPPPGNDSAGQGSATAVQATLNSLAETLRKAPYAEVFTALTYDSSAGQVVVHLTREDPAAMTLVRSAFPSGPPVVFASSAYTLAQCTQLEVNVQGNILYLRDRGIALLSTACNPDGRVVVEIRGTDTEKAIVQEKYGDMVVVTFG
jgi:hypothetical protein